jgi:hypothetical protein
VSFATGQQNILSFKILESKYPIVKMDWVDGGPLGVWLDARSSKTVDLQNARTQFRAISSFLEKEGIAHGDIQNGNVMMAPGGPRLIDYDARIAPVHSAQRPSRAAAQAAPPRPAVAAAPVPSPRPEIINTRIDAGAQCQYSPCE